MAATGAAALAGVTGVAAYLNAKFHVAQDIGAIRRAQKTGRYYEKLGTFPCLLFFEHVSSLVVLTA